MNRLQLAAAVLLTLLDALKQRGSWCGETHLQKSVYVLQGSFPCLALNSSSTGTGPIHSSSATRSRCFRPTSC